MKTYKVLIAEDTIEGRDILLEEFEKFRNLKKDKGIEIDFKIDECEHPVKALQKLSESSSTNEFYDILFIDIDFTEQAHKGGKRDSGFQIIKRAFEICPVSKICTYSGQFHAPDLSEQHQEMVKNGLVVKTFDKSRRDAGYGDWFIKGMEEVLKELEEQYFLFDIFKNNKLIKDCINELPFNLQWEIVSNIDTALILLKNLDNLSKYIFYRIVIYLYHQSLITFLTQEKTIETIKQNFEKNKSIAESLINPPNPLIWKEQNALSIIIAEGNIDFVRYGFKLNDYRNKSIHSDGKFTPDVMNVIFASLVLALYVLNDKSKINYQLIEEFISKLDQNLKGSNDLYDLINFVKSN